MMLSTKQLSIVTLVLSIYSVALYIIYLNFPSLGEDEIIHIKYPRNLEDAKQLGVVLSRYTDKHYYIVLSAVVALYIVLQSFAIPGSLFLTFLSGYLFNFYHACLLVCTCSAIGASVCYFFSQWIGRELIIKYYPEKIDAWQREVDKHRSNIFNYIFFLRVTPFFPNWFINMTSPIINVPLMPFFFGTMLGVAPPSFVFIQAGKTLNLITDTNQIWSWNSVVLLTFFASLSLLPVFFKKKDEVK
uniref:Transmembrane protein 41 homolog (inferred by orthology to a C. elegans protein) n=1 Tax=Strongyloides venezuelensis TaxID=75913 RepID=A0A0K0F181_STRVS